MYSNNSKMHEWKIIRILIPLGICAMVIGVIALISCYNTGKSYEVTITDKGIKDSKYMVFTKDEDENVYPFEVADNLFYFRWDSSDMYGKIEIGNTYKIKTIGWRVPLFSWYENIVSAEKIE